MPHTTTRQHRMICKGTWRPTSCAMTITNPVSQQPTPTCCRCSTKGGKQEQNLHTDGHSSPYNPQSVEDELEESQTEGLIGTPKIIRPSPEPFAHPPLPSAQASITPPLPTSQGQTPPYPSTSQP